MSIDALTRANSPAARAARAGLALAAAQLPVWGLVALGLLGPLAAAGCTAAGLAAGGLVLWRGPSRRAARGAARAGEMRDDGALTMEGLSVMSRAVLAPHGGRGAVLALDLGECGLRGEAFGRLLASVRMCMRRSDLVALTDGGRAIVLLPGLCEADARSVASRLRMSLARRAPLLGGRGPVPIGLVTILEGEGAAGAAVRAGIRADDDREAISEAGRRRAV